ncbi:MAG: DUF4405 domain-containing protein [Rhodobacter sp.]|uniref:DUF4405 domain-containing protein n=1 Tax=Pararhodobacter sp. TaxID=2127056 RepID=UPI001D3BF77E|nr:DUF4405 domain-containing protein [Pararhodobacter sp.]MCB1346880.1 DUF4405 domain-containing protein [Paracoccaceae bacterium]MCB1409754.1 DUF4405 domain-containing protein [Paracoccaceae bacterium]MCC0074748.1 DUF4405 domain-containing protein [Rhodobacter sp.]HPD93734.1 DUF4405 domain-containing protein [Pararhodobacter sp.]
MQTFINRYATPLVTGLFLVSLISGVALFLHWGSGWFHGMHEWLSMVLIVPFVLHLWKNWRPMLCYLKRAPLWIALAASTAAAALFVVPVGSGDGATGGRPPQFAFAERMMGTRLDAAAAALNLPLATLQGQLAASGLDAGTGETTLAQIATQNGVSTGQVMATVLAAGR